MPRGTNIDGSLAALEYDDEGGGKCEIQTPCGCITLRILPDISESKGATYVTDPAPGRSEPMTTYAYSDPRTFSTELHFMTTKSDDIEENIKALRIIQNLVLPGPSQQAAPFTPPPVVKFTCGVLTDNDGVCLILKNYNVRYPTEVAWDVGTFLPYRFTISCQWQVVYPCNKLPTNKCIKGGDPTFPNDFVRTDLIAKPM